MKKFKENNGLAQKFFDWLNAYDCRLPLGACLWVAMGRHLMIIAGVLALFILTLLNLK